MSDLLEEFYEENKIDINNVLDRVDDYSVFSFYIGEELEIGEKYSSPLRKGDDHPSFNLFISNKGSKRVKFKDHTLGIYGDCIDFVQMLLGGWETPVSVNDALSQINHDMELGLGGKDSNPGFKPKIVSKKKLVQEKPEIFINAKPFTRQGLDYWNKYGIGVEMLEKYKVKEVRYIHYVTSSRRKIITPKSLCFAYRVLDKYKVYQPFDSEFKFRNNYGENFVEGYLQIDWGNKSLCLITKAMKECMWFRQHFNIDAVAGKSESNMIPEHLMKKIIGHFDKVVVWLDNDETGFRFAKKYQEMYELPIIIANTVEKDPTDYYENHGKEKAIELVNRTLKL